MAVCSTSLKDTFFALKLIYVYENEMKHKDRINVTSTWGGGGDQFILLNILKKSFAEVYTYQISYDTNSKTHDFY